MDSILRFSRVTGMNVQAVLRPRTALPRNMESVVPYYCVAIFSDPITCFLNHIRKSRRESIPVVCVAGMNWQTTLARLLGSGGSRRQPRRHGSTAMDRPQGGSGAAFAPFTQCKCQRSAWTLVHESLHTQGITCAGNDNGVRMAPTASHDDGTYCYCGSATWDCDTAHWFAGKPWR